MILNSLFAKGVLGVAAASSVAFGAQGVKSDEHKKTPAARPQVEIVINANHALVRGATVTAVSGNTITATTALGSTTLAWTVVTDANTQVIASSSRSLSSVAVGDKINFSGSLLGSATSLTVNANVVKDTSKPFNEKDKKDKKDKHDGNGEKKNKDRN